MNIRHLRFFVALARERHHGRAASACNVTQSTLTEAIRQLEHDLGIPLLNRRGPRYGGLTPEGERILVWAQRILSGEDALIQALAQIKGGLSGELRFGVIPAAMPVTPPLTSSFIRRHPRVVMRVLSRTSMEIQRGVVSGDLDAGLTYIDDEPLGNVSSYPLYRERYLLLTPRGGALDHVSEVSWGDAARLPLCLLTPDMQNRRIMDRLFREGGAETISVAVETDSVLSLVAHVRSGEWSTVVPHTFLSLLGTDRSAFHGLQAIPLVGPQAENAVGFIVSKREPLAPLAEAFLDIVRKSEASNGVFDLCRVQETTSE